MTEPEVSLLKTNSIQDLLMLAAKIPLPEVPKEDGFKTSWFVNQTGGYLTATLKVEDWSGGLILSRTWKGEWGVGGQVTWSPNSGD